MTDAIMPVVMQFARFTERKTLILHDDEMGVVRAGIVACVSAVISASLHRIRMVLATMARCMLSSERTTDRTSCQETCMLAKDIMTMLTVRCTPHTTLREAANVMLAHHCACLPVVKDFSADSEIIGTISERDLVCRVVAEGLDPVMSTVWLAMSMPANTVHADATEEECLLRLRHLQVDRLVVVDQHGHPCGIISQGDLARQGASVPPEARSPPSSAGDRTCSGRLVSARTPSNRLRAIRPTVIFPPISQIQD
jgi:CBS domain-containing protein